MVDRTRQAGDPHAYLDYDPLPYELALRASYAAQGWILAGRGTEEFQNNTDTQLDFAHSGGVAGEVGKAVVDLAGSFRIVRAG